MSLTQYNVIPIQWLQFAIICTFSLHHTIIVNRKKPCPPIQEPRSAALEFTFSQSMKTWLPRSRSKLADACHFTKSPNRSKYTKLDQRETRACFPGDGRPWTEQHLCHNLWRAAAGLGACLLPVVALFLPGCLGCTGSLGNSCYLRCIRSLAFDQDWLVDAVWQRQYGRWLSW